MNTSSSLKGRLLARIQRTRRAPVFLRKDFEDLGDYDQVGRALRELVKEGAAVQLGYGVYARSRRSSITGNPVPDGRVAILAAEALRKQGVECQVGRAVRDNLEGRTTQVPIRDVINTGNRRITRRLGYGSATITYERDIESSDPKF